MVLRGLFSFEDPRTKVAPEAEEVEQEHRRALRRRGDVLKVLSLDILRNQLLEFLTQNRLPSVWAQDEFAWKDTLRFYAEEVRDTPLILTGKNLKHLRKLVITANDPAECIAKANPQYTWWGINWQFTLSDGKTFAAPYTTNLPEPPPNWTTQGTQ